MSDRQLLSAALALFGDKLPSNYLCFDMETTGFKRDDDLIVELGNCLVTDKKAKYYETHVLNWALPRYNKYIPRDWLEWKLKKCAKQMRRAGRESHMTIERMESEGSDPRKVLRIYRELLKEHQKNDRYIVGHNILLFDLSRIEFTLNEWLNTQIDLDEDSILDTAALEKAILTGMEPQPGETAKEYMLRVLHRPAPGVNWSLEPWCVTRHKLTEKYPSLHMEDAHSAGFDSMLVHLLLEEYRELARPVAS